MTRGADTLLHSGQVCDDGPVYVFRTGRKTINHGTSHVVDEYDRRKKHTCKVFWIRNVKLELEQKVNIYESLRLNSQS